MQELSITSGKELIELVNKHGMVLVYPESTTDYCISSKIITKVHTVMDHLCLFKVLVNDIEDKNSYYALTLDSNERNRHTVCIPDKEKQFVAVPRCALGKLEKILVSTISIRHKKSFFSTDIANILEVDKNYRL